MEEEEEEEEEEGRRYDGGCGRGDENMQSFDMGGRKGGKYDGRRTNGRGQEHERKSGREEKDARESREDRGRSSCKEKEERERRK